MATSRHFLKLVRSVSWLNVEWEVEVWAQNVVSSFQTVVYIYWLNVMKCIYSMVLKPMLIFCLKNRSKLYVVLQQQENSIIKLFFKIAMSTGWEEIKHTGTCTGTEEKQLAFIFCLWIWLKLLAVGNMPGLVQV